MPRATLHDIFSLYFWYAFFDSLKHRDFREIKRKSSQVKFWNKILVLKSTNIQPSLRILLVFGKGYLSLTYTFYKIVRIFVYL